MFAGLPSRGHGEYFRDLFQITHCVSLPPRDGSPGGHPLNRHLLLCLGPLTDLCHDFLASADTLHLHSVWVICDLWQTGSGGGWSPCALGSCSWRPLLSRLPCPNSILHSPFLLWRCCPFFSLFWFLSWMMSFFFYLFFFSSFLILSYLLHALHHHPLLPFLSSPHPFPSSPSPSTQEPEESSLTRNTPILASSISCDGSGGLGSPCAPLSPWVRVPTSIVPCCTIPGRNCRSYPWRPSWHRPRRISLRIYPAPCADTIQDSESLIS